MPRVLFPRLPFVRSEFEQRDGRKPTGAWLFVVFDGGCPVLDAFQGRGSWFDSLREDVPEPDSFSLLRR